APPLSLPPAVLRLHGGAGSETLRDDVARIPGRERRLHLVVEEALVEVDDAMDDGVFRGAAEQLRQLLCPGLVEGRLGGTRNGAKVDVLYHRPLDVVRNQLALAVCRLERIFEDEGPGGRDDSNGSFVLLLHGNLRDCE